MYKTQRFEKADVLGILAGVKAEWRRGILNRGSQRLRGWKARIGG